MAIIIRDNGQGPEIVGTGVSVFDVMDCLRLSWPKVAIAQLTHIYYDDLDATLSYVEENRAELNSRYEQLRKERASDFPRLEHALAEIRQHAFSQWKKGGRDAVPSHGFPPWPDFEKPFIFDRGRGPEIVGTRITVYHVMDYWKDDCPVAAIAFCLRLTLEQAVAAVEYIESYQEGVEREYQIILDRCERGNPPEIAAKLKSLEGSAIVARERLRNGLPLRDPSLQQTQEILSGDPAGRS